MVELSVHSGIVILLERVFGEIRFDEVTSILQKIFEFEDVHEVKPGFGFIQTKCRKMIGKESLHITMVRVLTMEDF
ncbi:MAG: hypothetical protein MJ115_06460 [Clostridia bacterium]|nr:hypothetical protein [Clostridia bacterium]